MKKSHHEFRPCGRGHGTTRSLGGHESPPKVGPEPIVTNGVTWVVAPINGIING